MFERRVECPQCRRQIRLTEAELAEKRGFCALCDARFEVLPDRFVGDGPWRDVPVAHAQLVVSPPPSRRVRAESDRALLLRPRRWLAAPFVLFAGFWFAHVNRLPGNATITALFLALGLLVVAFAAWSLLGWERLEVHGRTLRWSRGVAAATLSFRAVAVGDVIALDRREDQTRDEDGRRRSSHYLSIRSTSARAVRVGRWLGLDAEEVDWLREALTARLHAARA